MRPRERQDGLSYLCMNVSNKRPFRRQQTMAMEFEKKVLNNLL